MASGWSRDGAVQDQIDASVEDAIKLARSRLPNGEGLTHCEECENVIPDDVAKQFLEFDYVLVVSPSMTKSRRLSQASIDAAAKIVS